MAPDGTRKFLLQTKLVHHSDEDTIIDMAELNLADEEERLIKTSELNCLADKDSSLYVIDESRWSLSSLRSMIGKLVVGRPSTSFDMVIQSMHRKGDLMVFEGVPYDQFIKSRSAHHIRGTCFGWRAWICGDLDINMHYSYLYSKGFVYNAVVQGMLNYFLNKSE